MDLITSGYERKSDHRANESWGASDNSNAAPWAPQTANVGWGIAENRNHWGGWAKEVADVEEEQDDDDDDEPFHRDSLPASDDSVKVGMWTRKHKSKAPETGRVSGSLSSPAHVRMDS